ncbi:hypothetical protein OE88DRAFT_1666997 [Heliocybe sulcata]|uniref:protein-tyrosine-phosphatase n=1 Tax=Heliocybe sulcata TaxID=5364 RepID=A0A5C3MPQ6_9AGAM|nr:hypothetical protein OE88DRAFT_1666997 [Heliocybe sulcata]
MSRSATIAAAYLMYARNLDPAGALELIRKARPNTQPNNGFLQQLDIFYKASFKVSRRDKSTRMFYLERAVMEMMNGDGEIETEMFARYPPTPSDSAPPTPGGLHRRIRCKMCRTELARREHMMDHGQLGPATPAVPMGLSPANSRRPSMADQVSRPGPGRRGSGSMPDRRPSASATAPRRPSGLANDVSRAFLGGLAMTSSKDAQTEEHHDVFEDDSDDEEAEADASGTQPQPSDAMTVLPRSRSGSMAAVHPKKLAHLVSEGVAVGRGLSDQLSMTAAQEGVRLLPTPPPSQARSRRISANVPEGVTRSLSDSMSMTTLANGEDEGSLSDSARPPMSRRGSSTTTKKSALPLITENQPLPQSSVTSPTEMNGRMNIDAPMAEEDGSSRAPKPPPLSHGSDLAAQLFANPKLAALRSPMGMGMTPIQQSAAKPAPAMPAPILINPKCSGYFLEPMKWMEPFLEQGQLAGKIVCPNKKCGSKLGNYDWAGVCCSCKEWVTPGFCIHRSKVDEVV